MSDEDHDCYCDCSCCVYERDDSHGWRTIDTAPKDEDGCVAEVLVYDPDFGCAVAIYDWTLSGDGDWSLVTAECLGTKLNPTHWQPLPEPPEAE